MMCLLMMCLAECFTTNYHLVIVSSENDVKTLFIFLSSSRSWIIMSLWFSILFEYESETMPKLHWTAVTPGWNPGLPSHFSQDKNMLKYWVHIVNTFKRKSRCMFQWLLSHLFWSFVMLVLMMTWILETSQSLFYRFPWQKRHGGQQLVLTSLQALCYTARTCEGNCTGHYPTWHL